MLEKIAARFCFVRTSTVHKKLQFARSVGKGLDEHRKVVEAVEKTGFFEGNSWNASHMGTQDDYLMRLYRMVYGSWPEDLTDDKYGGRQVNAYVRAQKSLARAVYLSLILMNEQFWGFFHRNP